MNQPFRVGITPDFYEQAKGRFEQVVEQEFGPLEGVNYGSMPPQPGNLATPDALNQFDGIFSLALKFTRESLVGVERLAVVARWGVGYDMIDVDALTEADVMLAITPKAVRRPVAEAILALIFGLSKNLLIQDRTARAGKWRGDLPHLGYNIGGRVLGSVGCGNIAREMFRLARSLGFSRLIACDPYVQPGDVADLDIEIVDMDTVFSSSDFVTVNTLLNQSTRGLVGEHQFRLMKPTAFFVNTSRGPIVDESALVDALREGRIRGAGIDVFEQEPPPKDHPLFAMDNVIVAPHAVAWTEELRRDNGLEACGNILAVARGELPDGIVNREVLERPGFQQKLARYKGEQ